MSKIEIRAKENQNLWNFILSIFFLAIVTIALWEVWGEHGSFPHSVSLFDATLMALAAFRVTRLMVYDKITRWFRELFVQKKYLVDESGDEYVELIPYESGLLHTLHDLLGCPWCIGFWSSLVIVFCYFMFTWAWILILFLAVAGVGSLFQLTANLVGWHAELAKLAVKEAELR